MKIVISAAVLFLCVSFAHAEPAPAKAENERAAELVRELGDARFKVRDAAARELRRMGRSAKQAVEAGIKNTDPEISRRCIQLLPEIMALDLQSRIDAFLADKDSKRKHNLPLIETYSKTVGLHAAGRELYMDIIKENGAFLEDCLQNPKLAGEKCLTRAKEIQSKMLAIGQGGQGRPQMNPSDIAPLFLLGADSEMSKNIPGDSFVPALNFMWQAPFQNALNNGEQAAPFRKLFVAWANGRTDVDSISNALAVVLNNNVKEGAGFAVKMMRSKDLRGWTRAQAITVVGKFGGKEHVSDMVAMFGDKAQVANVQRNNVKISTQVNDVALAMAVHLTGQNHLDYGFDLLQNQPALLWAYQYHGFSTDEKRAAAFKKWDGWSEEQKKDPVRE
jgi:hypothetical protein